MEKGEMPKMRISITRYLPQQGSPQQQQQQKGGIAACYETWFNEYL